MEDMMAAYPLERVLRDLVEACRLAGENGIRRRGDVRSGAEKTRSKYSELGSESIRDLVHRTVTAVDGENQEIFLVHMHDRYPDASCSVEEDTQEADRPPTLRAMLAVEPTPHVFVVDALDGTANYALGIGRDWAVCAGYLYRRVMQVAVIWFPETEELYWAVRGTGAFCAKGPADTSRGDMARRLVVDPAVFSGGALDLRHWQYLRELGIDDPSDETNLTCTARELTEIAEGRGGQYISGSLTKLVDAGVGRTIVELAGGASADLRGRPIEQEPPDRLQPNGERLAYYADGLVITRTRAELAAVLRLVRPALLPAH